MSINHWQNARAHYVIIADDGNEYSAGDYAHAPDDLALNSDLYRKTHTYRTVTGREVCGLRLIRSNVTIRRLRQLERVRASLGKAS